MDGITTTSLTEATLVDALLGNWQGSTRRISIDRLVALVASLMGPTYATRAELYDDRDWPAGAVGYVRADSPTAYNGVYKKAGSVGGGSWSRVGNLPSGAVEQAAIDDLISAVGTLAQWGDTIQLVHATGTADAVTAERRAAQDDLTANDGTLISIQWPLTNTAPDPTLTVGDETWTVRRQNSQPVEPGEMVGGRYYTLRRAGSQVRIVGASGISDIFGLGAALADLAQDQSAADQALARQIERERSARVRGDQVSRDDADDIRKALANPIRRAALMDPHRPGDGPQHYTSSLAGGDPYDAPAATGEMASAEGSAIVITGDGLIGQRGLHAMEPARQYRVRFVVRRLSNSPDPANDSVTLGLAWYDRMKTPRAPAVSVVAELTSLDVADGRTEVEALVSRAPGGDIAPPGGTIYARPFVRTHGTTGRTEVQIIDWQDVTDLTVWSPDVAGFAARMGALESLDIESRLGDLEASAATAGTMRFATRNDAVAAHIRASAEVVDIPGLGVFRRATSGIAFTSADGSGWSPVGGASPEQFGIGSGDLAADTAAMNAFLSHVAAGHPGRADGTYHVHDTLTVPTGARLHLTFGPTSELVFHGSGDLTPLTGCLTIGSDGAYDALPALARDVLPGDMSVVFAEAPALQRGDLFVVYNADPGSWGGWSGRDYYRRGDYLRVVHRIANVVYLQGAVVEGYSILENLRVIKPIVSTVELSMQGRIIGLTGAKPNAIWGYNLLASTVSIDDATGFAASALQLARAYDTTVRDSWIGVEAALPGTGYGVSMIACHNVWVRDSSLFSTRHAVSITGGGITGGIPNRFCGAEGCTLKGNEMAADMHGSVDHCGFVNCQIEGGVQLAGKNSRLVGGSVSTLGTTEGDGRVVRGVALRMRQLANANHLIQGVTFHQNHDLSPEAIEESYTFMTLRFDLQQAPHGFEFAGDLALRDLTIMPRAGLADPEIRIRYSLGFAGQASAIADNIRTVGGTARLVIQTQDEGWIDAVAVSKCASVATKIEVQAPKITGSAIANHGAGTDGLLVGVIGTAVPRRQVRLSDCDITKSPYAGIAIAAPGNTGITVAVDVLNCTSLDNHQAGDGGANHRTSIRLENLIGHVSLRGNTVGDTQAAPSQEFAIAANNCPMIHETDNIRLGTAPVRLIASAMVHGTPPLIWSGA